MSERQLSLNLFIYPNGHHEAAWRHPQSVPESSMDIGYYQQLALRAEREKLDAIFFADSPSLAESGREGLRIRFEPVTWLAAIAAVTQRIGLIATASTTYSEPYNLARSFSALDHLSKGRAGWNIVTTSMAAAAANFGLDEHPSAHDRYAQAEEFVQVVGDLWDSWEDDALVLDKTAGVFADSDKVHSINHVGAYYKVKGPLNSPRSPQGRPVQVQAGSSEDGRDFAARHAEAIFTAHQTLHSATEFANDIRARARAVGRDPRQLKILPGISPYIASTEAEAQRKFDELNELVLPHVSLGQLRRMLGVDLSGQDLDAPFPRHLINFEGVESQSSRFKLIIDIVDREHITRDSHSLISNDRVEQVLNGNQLARVTAHSPGPGTDVVGKLGGAVQGLVRGKDRLGMPGGKVPAVLGRTGLHLHRQRGEFGLAFGDGVFKLGGAFGPLFRREGF